jgi:hypothetical protein
MELHGDILQQTSPNSVKKYEIYREKIIYALKYNYH